MRTRDNSEIGTRRLNLHNLNQLFSFFPITNVLVLNEMAITDILSVCYRTPPLISNIINRNLIVGDNGIIASQKNSDRQDSNQMFRLLYKYGGSRPIYILKSV